MSCEVVDGRLGDHGFAWSHARMGSHRPPLPSVFSIFSLPHFSFFPFLTIALFRGRMRSQQDTLFPHIVWAALVCKYVFGRHNKKKNQNPQVSSCDIKMAFP